MRILNDVLNKHFLIATITAALCIASCSDDKQDDANNPGDETCTGESCSQKNDETSCTDDPTICQNDETCVNGECKKNSGQKTCTDDPTICQNGETCVNDECKKNSGQKTCTDDPTICQNDEYCVNSKCRKNGTIDCSDYPKTKAAIKDFSDFAIKYSFTAACEDLLEKYNAIVAAFPKDNTSVDAGSVAEAFGAVLTYCKDTWNTELGYNSQQLGVIRTMEFSLNRCDGSTDNVNCDNYPNSKTAAVTYVKKYKSCTGTCKDMLSDLASLNGAIWAEGQAKDSKFSEKDVETILIACRKQWWTSGAGMTEAEITTFEACLDACYM